MGNEDVTGAPTSVIHRHSPGFRTSPLTDRACDGGWRIGEALDWSRGSSDGYGGGWRMMAGIMNKQREDVLYEGILEIKQ